jgi:threonine/homoserine/homoserine lactone efflux protein
VFTLSYWIPFLIAAFLINISPGTEFVFVVSQTISSGKKDGFLSALGAGTGSIVHVLMVAFGLAYILSKSLIVFNIIKILGAAYLIYLGIRAIISKNMQIDIEKKEIVNINSKNISYFRGILVGLLNPSSIIFFMSFLPQFVKTDVGGYFFQIIMLGFITIFMGIIINVFVIFMINYVRNVLLKSNIVLNIINKIMGSVLIFLGIRFLVSVYKD